MYEMESVKTLWHVLSACCLFCWSKDRLHQGSVVREELPHYLKRKRLTSLRLVNFYHYLAGNESN